MTTLGDHLLHHRQGITREWCDLPAGIQQLGKKVINRQSRSVVQVFEQRILDRERVCQACPQSVGVSEVGDLYNELQVFVRTERGNSRAGRTELPCSKPFFLARIQQAVVGQDDLRTIGDPDIRPGYAAFLEVLEFPE